MKIKAETGKLLLTLSPDLKNKIQEFCTEREISVSAFCRLAIREYLKNHGQD